MQTTQNMTAAKHQGGSAKRRIHDSVKSGDVKELEMMVKDGASVNEVDSTKDHFTPVHWACYAGQLECLHWLLWHGADPTVATPTGLTAAHVAAIRGQDACVQALVNNGVNMAARDHRGSTPLHMAATHGHSFTLHSLLRAGVDVNVVDKNGWTPLHNAAFHGRLSCMQLLVRWGCLLNDTESAGCTTAHLAAMEGHLDCLKFICSESPSAAQVLGARNNNGETPKMLAENFYKSEVVEYIVNIEWERTHPEEASNMAFPAHVAAYTGDLEHLRMLIENQIVNINERDDKGSTPAHKAAGQGHLDILQWLMEMGADMTISNLAGETARDIARRFARLAAVRLLSRGQEEADEAADRALRACGDDDDDCDDDDEEIYINGKDKKKKTSKSKIHDKEAKGRAKKKMEELERELEIAMKNYVQLGGGVKGEHLRREREEREVRRNIADLESQLDQERNRREKLEMKLDQYKLDVAYLTSQLDQLSTANSDRDFRSERPKKTTKKKTGPKEDGYFVRRNVGSARKSQTPLKIL